MAQRIGVITFPGSLDDDDAALAVERAGASPVRLWHADAALGDVDGVILPGGFSYGDYLRCGALAHRAPVMRAVRAFAADGGPVLGICNGFQILCEAGLLPGALLPNVRLRFQCRPEHLRIEARTPWTADYPPGTVVRIPAKNGAGRYHADGATLDRLEDEERVVVRYLADVNGSARRIAGVCSDDRNVVGLMPHPEHAVDPALVGGTDGLGFFRSLSLAAASSGRSD